MARLKEEHSRLGAVVAGILDRRSSVIRVGGQYRQHLVLLGKLLDVSPGLREQFRLALAAGVCDEERHWSRPEDRRTVLRAKGVQVSADQRDYLRKLWPSAELIERVAALSLEDQHCLCDAVDSKDAYRQRQAARVLSGRVRADVTGEGGRGGRSLTIGQSTNPDAVHLAHLTAELRAGVDPAPEPAPTPVRVRPANPDTASCASTPEPTFSVPADASPTVPVSPAAPSA